MSRLLLLCSLILSIAAPSASEDLLFDFEEAIDAVSDGELRFLDSPPEKPVHHHFNRIEITEKSLLSGWVRLRQCHYNLDPVHALEIVYRPERIHNLQILSHENLGFARVEESRVQISDIQRNGQICIQAESKALLREGNGYLLQNGPYMRRFLDGYYPMQITLELAFPESLRIRKVSPSQETGLNIEIGASSARLNGWFEGMLYTRIWLCRGSDSDCAE